MIITSKAHCTNKCFVFIYDTFNHCIISYGLLCNFFKYYFQINTIKIKIKCKFMDY